MKKLTGLFTVFFFSITCFAGGITFVNNLSWAEIRAKAVKENKMIFFDAYASWCGPCKYLESNVYTDKDVAGFYNANFINVKFDMETGEGISLAEEFEIGSYPTLLFFSTSGELVHKYIGAMEPAEFIALGLTAKDPAKQYYTLKEKARKLQLTDAQFASWAEMADKMEDADKTSIIEAYLATKKDVLANADIAKTVLLYASDLTDQQLAFIYRNREKIAKLSGWNEEKSASALYSILFSRAVRSYERNDDNLDSFRFQVRKLDPAKEHYAVKDLQFRLVISGDNIKATNLLIQYLEDKKQPLNIEDIAGWVLDYNSYFEKENYQVLKDAFSKFTLRTIDRDREYWLYLVQLICEMNLGNEAEAKTLAEKAYRHPLLPDDYKRILESSYGLR